MHVLNPEVFRKSGKFLVAPGREVSGELHVAGRGTSLYLRADEKFNPHAIPGGCVTGVLHDLTRVTLIQCITLEGLGSSTRGSERYYFAKLFPHFVVEGRRHLEPNANVIVEITFVLEDATALF